MQKNTAPRKRSGGTSKRAEMKLRRRREQQRQKWIPIVLVSLAAVAIAAVLIVPNLMNSVGGRPLSNGTAMGNPDAKVVVEEFADFQCPSCAVFFNDLEPNIVKNYVSTGKIYFKFVPYAFIGPESIAAAEAAYCANDQGKFWQYHDTLYANQRGENQGNFSAANLVGFAKDLGLDTTTFKQCLDSEKYKQQVDDDLNYGKQKGIDRTPSFLVNGRLVYADTVSAVIESTVNSLDVNATSTTSGQ